VVTRPFLLSSIPTGLKLTNLSSLKIGGFRIKISSKWQRQAGNIQLDAPFTKKIKFLAIDLKIWRKSKPKLSD